MSEYRPHRQYDPAYLTVAQEMMRNGATVWDLADALEVSVTSVELWGVCHRDFGAVLRVGREEADDRVERAWYSRCVGYVYDSEKIYMTEGGAVRVPVREHVLPDPGACAAWLRNRRPEQWNERHEFSGTIQHRGGDEDGPVLDLESCSPDEIQREYAAALAAARPSKRLPPAAADRSR